MATKKAGCPDPSFWLPSHSVPRSPLRLGRSPLSPARGYQRCPVVGRIAPAQHPREYRIRVGLAARRAQGLLIIDPGVGEHLRPGVIAKEQAKPPPDLRAPPMPACGAQGVALPELFARRITRHHVHHQLAQRAEQLDVGVAREPVRVVPLRSLHRRVQPAQLLDHALVEE